MQQQVFGHFILNTFLFFISSLDTACNDQNDDNEKEDKTSNYKGQSPESISAKSLELVYIC